MDGKFSFFNINVKQLSEKRGKNFHETLINKIGAFCDETAKDNTKSDPQIK